MRHDVLLAGGSRMVDGRDSVGIQLEQSRSGAGGKRPAAEWAGETSDPP